MRDWKNSVMFGKSFTTKTVGHASPPHLLLISASLLFLATLSSPTRAQEFSKSFKVLPDSGSLEIKSKNGSVTVVPAVGNTIQITARQGANNINAVQAMSQGKVMVEVTNEMPVELMISVPASTALDVLCVKCGIVVKGLYGAIKVSNMDNDIQLTGIHSSKVEARSMTGSVYYSGDVAASGNYSLRSFSGRVDADLPAGAKFNLEATSGRGGIDIHPGDFDMNVQKQTSQLMTGWMPSASAKITLWTQEGSIRVRKK